MNEVVVCGACGTAMTTGDVYCGACGRAASVSTEPTSSKATPGAEPAAALQTNEIASPRTGAAPLEARRPAGFFHRLAAWIIDAIIVGGPAALIATLGGVDPSLYTFWLWSIPVSIVYRPVLWSLRDGQTVGQQLLQIRVLDSSFKPISGLAAVWRVLATWILILGCTVVGLILVSVALFSMLWNDAGRTWFDRWSDSYVMKVPTKPL